MIYKYFSQIKYQNSFLDKGEVCFNSLSYFLSCEDNARKDITEGASLYRPFGGLVGNSSTGGSFVTSKALISQIKRPDRFFIFSTSMELSDSLYNKFRSVGAVEISDIEEFNRMLRHGIQEKIRKFIIKNPNLISGRVDYYNYENEPETRHARPDIIAMSKLAHPNFTMEKEYRFLFAKDRDAFNVNNVNHSLASEISLMQGPHPKIILNLGSLHDICKVVR